MQTKKETFSSRFGFIVSLMGIAIGAGNIWRFPRIVAQNGCGSFLLIWAFFLFSWSIPLIIIELALGKLSKSPPVEAFKKISKEKYTWMGIFIPLVTTCILAYYSSIVGWGLSYCLFSFKKTFILSQDYSQVWSNYISSKSTVIAYLFSLFIGMAITYKGVSKGIENLNKFLIPFFLLCITLIFIKVLSLEGAFQGIKFLFHIEPKFLLNYKTWIEALTQNAWDTGAGWGLLFIYATYMRKNETIVKNGALTAIANNLISLIMAIIMFSSVGALTQGGLNSLKNQTSQSNIGFMFTLVPEILSKFPGPLFTKMFFSALFFLAFFIAALSSMISMILLSQKTLQSLGLSKTSSLLLTGGLTSILGLPSAINLKIFENQDAVWGIALIINGLFLLFSAKLYGLSKLKDKIINNSIKDIKINNFFIFIIKWVLPIEGLFLLFWFIVQSFKPTQGLWFHLFQPSCTAGTLFLQWGAPILILYLLNKKINLKIKNTKT